MDLLVRIKPIAARNKRVTLKLHTTPMPLSLHPENCPMMCVSGSYRHPLLLKLGIIVAALCCWFLMSMGIASAQSDPLDLSEFPASAPPAGEGAAAEMLFQNIPSVYGAV